MELTQELYRRYGSNLQQDFVIIGPSMGALVAQYSLAYAETNNINTHTRLYISFDGPHQGANGGIGMQQLVDYMAQKSLLSKVFKKLRNLKDGLHRGPAARQMLVHNSTAESETPAPDNFRNIFLSNLASVNNYPNRFKDPSKIRKVAIVNGSSNLSPNIYLQPEGEILYMRIKRAGLLGVVNGRAGDRLNISINASPASGRTTTADTWLFKPIINLVSWKAPRVRYYTQPAPNNSSYDASVGSYFGDLISPKTDEKIRRYQTLLYLFGGNDSDLRHNIMQTFMPTTSAADLQMPGFTLAYNFQNEDIGCTGKSPFDRVYAPTTNQTHVQITDENALWFDNEIKGTPQPFPAPQFPITGPDNFCTSQTYSINNLPAGSTITWSVSPSGIVSTSASGNSVTLTRIINGSITLTASVTSACGNTTTSKPVTVGLQTLSVSSYVDRTPQESNYQYLTATAEQLAGTVPGDYSWYEEVNGMRGSQIATGLQLRNYPIPPCTTVYYQCVATTSCGEAVYRGYAYNTYCGGYAISSSLVAYPNPASTELNINNTDEAGKKDDAPKDGSISNAANPEFQVRLYNEKGNVLRSAKNPKGSKGVKLDITDIPNGTYYLHIIKGKEVLKKQIIIQH